MSLVALGASLGVGAPVTAQTAVSPAALCRTLRRLEVEADLGPASCRVVRRARRGGVRAAVLRIENARAVALRLATGDGGAWRVVRDAGAAYRYQGMVGELEVRSLAVRQSIPGGGPEIDLVTRRWQGLPLGCAVRGREELHRYVCTAREGWWCMHVAIGAGREEVRAREPGCSLPVLARPAEPWSIALRFTPDTVRVRRRAGALPDVMRAWLGEHALEALPEGGLPSLPDTL